MKYDKLVRDKIPELIVEHGDSPVTHVASDSEYWEKLRDKLLEEAQEFNKDGSVEELADLLEVIDAIIEYRKFDREELAKVKNDKWAGRGGFTKRIILEES